MSSSLLVEHRRQIFLLKLEGCVSIGVSILYQYIIHPYNFITCIFVFRGYSARYNVYTHKLLL
jgi:hypothetical protein